MTIDAIYSFHVLGFLLIPFIYPRRTMNFGFVQDRIIRYLVPFFFTYLLACLLFRLIISSETDFDLWIVNVAIGGLVASTRTLDPVCGFKMFWFLPAFLSLVLMKGFIERLKGRLRLFSFFIVFSLFGIVGVLPDELKKYIPLGFGIAMYSLSLGIVLEKAWNRVRDFPNAAVAGATGLVFLGSLIAAVKLQSFTRVGGMYLPNWTQPMVCAIHMLLPISALLFIVSIAPWLVRVRFLTGLGRHSLYIYLLHGLIFQGQFIFAEKLMPDYTDSMAFGIGLLLSTLMFAAMCSVFINANEKIRSLVSPSRYSDWTFVRVFQRILKSWMQSRG